MRSDRRKFLFGGVAVAAIGAAAFIMRPVGGSTAAEGTFEITDLSSTNGTVVDGEAVESTMKLRDGAIIFVGSHVIVFRVATSAHPDR